DARCSAEALARLWRLAVAHTGDTAFGIQAARHALPTSFHALGYALTASPTLGDAFERVARYYRVITEAWSLQFSVQGDMAQASFVNLPGHAQPEPESLDAAAALLVRMVRGLLADRQINPILIELQREAPADRLTFERAFRCPITFGAGANRVVWASSLMSRRLEGAHPALAQHNEQILSGYLARLDKSNLVAQLKALLPDCLPHGEPSQTQLAERLHVSTRTLQRRLQEQGTRFSDVLDQVRRELAMSYLAQSHYTINEVAFLLGFADNSNFTRAFKRWTGMSPTQHRQTNGSRA
ncbi:MAG TPA: AraC family transcriptional regulator, partial [Aquabacterium sp.]|nr:AraC family transcriptional regulator [Aquabacterium sp.]